jgi:hypothetical protein
MKARIVWFRLGDFPGDQVVHIPKGAFVLMAALHGGLPGICAQVPDPPLTSDLGRPHTFRMVSMGVAFDLGDSDFCGIIELPTAALAVYEIRTVVQNEIHEGGPGRTVAQRVEDLEERHEEDMRITREAIEALEGSGTHLPVKIEGGEIDLAEFHKGIEALKDGGTHEPEETGG